MVRKLLVVLTVVLALGAARALGATYTSFSLSGAFNMEFWISPTMYATCQSNSNIATTVFGLETATPYAYAFDMADQNTMPVVDATYGTVTVSGTGGFPANGTLVSLNADARTYYVPSLNGNTLYSGDQIESTNSNVLIVGKGRTGSGGVPYNIPSATMSVTAGYYSDINFILTAGVGLNNVVKAIGAQYIQIWAVYSDTSSTKLYDFSNSPSAVVYSGGQPFYGPPFTAAPSTTDSDFQAIYTASYTYYNYSGAGSVGNTHGPLNLFEFVTPRTLNSSKTLTAIAVIDADSGQSGNYSGELAILAATATPASYTLTASASPAAGGTLAVTPSQAGYSSGSVVTISETTNTGYTFNNWSATGGSLGNANAATTTMTINANCTLTANYTQNTYTLSAAASPTAGGTVAVSPSQASYHYNDQVSISQTTNPGYTFNNWSVTGGSINASTLTIQGNVTLTANYTQNSYSGTETDVGGGITLSNNGPYVYGQVITATESANAGYGFAGWSITGASTLSSTSAVTTSLTVYDNFTLTASFTVLNYNVTGVAGPSAGGTVNVGSATGTYGQTISISQTTNAGYSFTGWTLNDGSHGAAFNSGSTAVIVGTANVTVTANYTAISYNVTGVASPGAGGTVNVGSATGTIGQTISISQTTNPGYTFNNWTLTGAGATFNSGSTAVIVGTANVTVTANYTQNSYSGTETDVGGGITLSNSGPYTYGQVITATESANAGYAFAGWSITGASTLSSTSAVTTSLTVYDNFTLTASFTQLHYTLSAAASPAAGGTVAVTPSQATYTYGNVVTVSETVNTGYTFVNWTATGGALGNANAATTTMTINANCTLTANYTQNTYTLSAAASPTAGGTVAVSPSQASYHYNDQVSISQTTTPGYTFNNWSVTGGSINASTLTIQGNVTLTANYTQNSYSGTETDVGGGITLSNSGPYTYGQVITATEAANNGYAFAGWSITGASTLSSTSAVTTSLTVYDNFTLTASFTQLQYTVTVNQTTGGTVAVSPSQATYTYSTTATVTATASSGYNFSSWSVSGGTVSPSASSATLTVQGNVTLSANFTAAGGGPTPLSLAGACNMEFWISPTMFATCQSASNIATTVFGLETSTPYAYAFDMGYQNTMPVVNATYGGTVVSGGSGVGGFPANGTLISLNADGRTYYFPSLSGNTLYSGDQLESSNSNVLIVGKGRTSGVPYNISSATITVPSGNYTDINFLLTAGVGLNNVLKAIGAQYIQIWAVYSDTSSTKLYDFSTGPNSVVYSGGQSFYGPPFAGASNTDSDFHAVYTASYTYYNYGGSGAVGNTYGPLYLYEFVTPLALNSSKTLTAIALIDANSGQSGNYSGELAILAATATATGSGGASYTLTASANPAAGGTVAVTPSQATYAYGSVVTISETANSGYTFANWTATGGSLGNASAATTTMTINANCTLSASYTSNNYTLTAAASPAAGGTLAVTPSQASYAPSSVVTISETVNAGYTFVNWTATGGALGNANAATTTMTINANCTLSANYTQNNYSGTETVTGGSISLSNSGPYTYGQVITATESANAGYSFAGWGITGPSTLSSTSAVTTSLTVYDNFTLTASFTQLQYTVTVNQTTGGTVTVSPSQATYTYSNTATVTATVTNSSYTFSSWNVTGGTVSPSTSQATLTVQGNVTLSANFTQGGTGTLTVNTAHGTVSVTPSQANYNYGATITITTSTVDTGYVLDHWNLSGVGTLSNSCALTTSLTLEGNDTLTAVYVTGSYVNNLNPAASDSNVGSLASPFKTIGKATGLAKAGSTIVVLQGVYREQPSLTNNGTSGNPITLKSNSGDRVVINGAKVIPSAGGSWTQCTAVTASGNPNYANIYYTDINWNPVAIDSTDPLTVFQDETPLAWAQTPYSSWWVPTGGTSTTLIDTVNLTQTDSNYWNGAIVYLWDAAGVYQYMAPITGYTPATHTLTASETWEGNSTAVVTADFYCLQNSLKSLTGSGQVVAVPSVSGSYRVFVWPAGGGRPDGHLFEGNTKQTYWIGLGAMSYWVFSGLEVCNDNGSAFGNSGGGNASNYCTVQNCVLHHNLNGFYLNNNPHIQLLNNYITRNGNGVNLFTPSPSSLVQGNEISWNGMHGINFCSSSSSLLGNYIHDHIMAGHTDNIQIYNSSNSSSILTHMVFQDNLVINASQGIMMSEVAGPILFRGNDFMCSFACLMQSYPNDYNYDFEHNTIMWGAYGDVPLGNYSTAKFYNNLYGDYDPFGYLNMSLATLTATYTADYNLYWSTLTGSSGVCLDLGPGYTFPQYTATTGDDTHGLAKDPKFTNLAKIFIPGGFGLYKDFAPNHFYGVNGIPAQVAVGDYLCIDFDGVPRQITAINTTSGFVTFTPSDAKFSWKYGTALDWQASQNFAIDLTLQAGSPAIGAANDGGNIGSSINVANYKANNFGAYGSRPTWPPTPANVSSWAASTTTQGFGTITEGQTLSSPNDVIKAFKVTLDATLNGVTITTSAITIVDTGGTNYASYISAASLDSTAKILTVTLSSSLPTSKTYIIALNPAVYATNGGPVRGAKSIKIVDN